MKKFIVALAVVLSFVSVVYAFSLEAGSRSESQYGYQGGVGI